MSTGLALYGTEAQQKQGIDTEAFTNDGLQTETGTVSKRLLVHFAGSLQQTGLSLAEAFRKYDTNGNMVLDNAEFTAMMHDFCPEACKVEVQQLMKAADEDRNGTVDFKEFRCTFGRYLSKVGANSSDVPRDTPPVSPAISQTSILKNSTSTSSLPTASNTKGTGMCLSPWCAADAEVSLSPNALSAARKDIVQEITTSLQCRSASLQEAFDSFDKNGSGRLEQHEFLGMVYDICPGTHKSEALQALWTVDRDRSGDVDFSEFKAAFGRVSLSPKDSSSDLLSAIRGPSSQSLGGLSESIATDKKSCAPCGYSGFSWLCGKPKEAHVPNKNPQVVAIARSQPTYATYGQDSQMPDPFSPSAYGA